MNFLAHVFLSGLDESLILGNLIADAVKGKQFDKYNPEVQSGILLHRKIDRFTDDHDIVRQSKKRLEERYKKFAGIIVDIYYDHFLSANFSFYSEIPIQKIADNAYEVLIRNYDVLPPHTKRIMPYMINHNWFVQYADFKFLGWVFHGMSKRTKFDSGMETAVDELRIDYLLYQTEFMKFFPQLIEFTEREKRNLIV